MVWWGERERARERGRGGLEVSAKDSGGLDGLALFIRIKQNERVEDEVPLRESFYSA